MLLYKFKSLQNIKHSLDIIFKQRLYCSLYKDLNDPFDGHFRIEDYVPNQVIHQIYEAVLKHPLFERGKVVQYDSSNDSEIDKIPLTVELDFEEASKLLKIQDFRVCSLTTKIDDVRLWAYYADSCQGIAIEVEIPESEKLLHKVSYSNDVPSIGLRSVKNQNSLFATKSQEWSFESEYKIVQKNIYYELTNMNIKVYLGPNITQENKNSLYHEIPTSVEIIEMTLDRRNRKIIKK